MEKILSRSLPCVLCVSVLSPVWEDCSILINTQFALNELKCACYYHCTSQPPGLVCVCVCGEEKKREKPTEEIMAVEFEHITKPSLSWEQASKITSAFVLRRIGEWEWEGMRWVRRVGTRVVVGRGDGGCKVVRGATKTPSLPPVVLAQQWEHSSTSEC